MEKWNVKFMDKNFEVVEKIYLKRSVDKVIEEVKNELKNGFYTSATVYYKDKYCGSYCIK